MNFGHLLKKKFQTCHKFRELPKPSKKKAVSKQPQESGLNYAQIITPLGGKQGKDTVIFR